MADSPMSAGEKRTFAAGETIYAQGSESTGVYLLLEGQVDIWFQDTTDMHHIASIGTGELLGEVSVIQQYPHSVMAKASTPVTALFIHASAFRKSFSDPLVRHVVHTLSARLRKTYTSPSKEHNGTTAHKSSHPTIEGRSALVAKRLLTFVELTDFPFLVGNIATKSKHCLITDTLLRVPLPGIPELSDNHFEIVKRDHQLHVKDLGSSQGTTVNGEHLSKYALNATARLKPGKNEIVAGREDSPVRFTVTLPASFST